MKILGPRKIRLHYPKDEDGETCSTPQYVSATILDPSGEIKRNIPAPVSLEGMARNLVSWAIAYIAFDPKAWKQDHLRLTEISFKYSKLDEKNIGNLNLESYTFRTTQCSLSLDAVTFTFEIRGNITSKLKFQVEALEETQHCDYVMSYFYSDLLPQWNQKLVEDKEQLTLFNLDALANQAKGLIDAMDEIGATATIKVSDSNEVTDLDDYEFEPQDLLSRRETPLKSAALEARKRKLIREGKAKRIS